MTNSSARVNHRLTFLVLSVGVVAFGLLQSLLLPLLPTIQDKLGTTQSDVTWVVTSYLLSASVFTPILGRIGDMKGKRRVLVLILVTVAIGCLVSAVATSLPLMIAGRLLQGLGGGILPLSFSIVREEFPEHQMVTAVGAIAAILSLGVGIGVVLSGPILDSLGYFWVFGVPSIVLLLAAVGALIFIPDSRDHESGRLSVLNAALMTIWLLALLLAVSQASSWGWGSLRVCGLLAVAAIVVLWWIRVEARSVTPLVDMTMMRLRAVWTVNITTIALGATTYAMAAFIPLFVQTPSSAGYGFGSSTTEAGLVMLPSTMGMFVMGLFTGRLARRFGAKVVMVAGITITTAPLVVLAFVHHTIEHFYIGYGLMGLGIGLSLSSIAAIIVGAVPRAQTGVASGMNANLRTIGGALGTAVMTAIVGAHLLGSGRPAEIGYTRGFLVMAGIMVIGLLAALLAPGSGPSPRRNERAHVREAELRAVAGGTIAGD